MSVFEDWRVYIQKKDLYEKPIVRELKNSCGPISKPVNCAVSFYLNHIAIATESTIVVYSYDMLRLEGFCSLPDLIKEIKQMIFGEPFDILIVIDANLTVVIFSLVIDQ